MENSGGYLVPNGFVVDMATLAAARPGDIITLHGERMRVVKKTNRAMSVEPYTWRTRVEEWVLEQLGRFLP